VSNPQQLYSVINYTANYKEEKTVEIFMKK